jgi:flavorubredoxin
MDAVVYVSKGGNTRKLAEAIAKGAGVKARTAADAENSTQVDTLFIGASLYAGRISGSLRQFIRNLKAKQAAQVVVFGTSASGKSAVAEIKTLLASTNIPVSEESFCCKGSFLCINSGRPNAGDLAQAEDFARRIGKGGR